VLKFATIENDCKTVWKSKEIPPSKDLFCSRTKIAKLKKKQRTNKQTKQNENVRAQNCHPK